MFEEANRPENVLSSRIISSQIYEVICMVSININVEKCTGCGTCIDVCPVEIFELQETEGKTLSVVRDDFKSGKIECLICRVCEVSCTEEAIEVIE